MKIAFLHAKSAQAAQLLLKLPIVLPEHELLSWPLEELAPANDIRILLALAPVGRAQLERLSKLELVQTISAGFESVDLDAANELGIWVSNSPAGLTGNAASVAEMAIMLLIGASRHLADSLRPDMDQTPVPTTGQALSGKTICIVGLGSIGRNLVDRLRAFGLTIVATNEDVSRPMAGVSVYPASNLKLAVADADYVVICVPGSRENENLIDSSVLGAMKRGVILVNVARGSVVDESALCAALNSGQVAAVGLDVLRAEPEGSNNPLRRFPQALITPHIAGDTDITTSGTLTYIVKIVREWDGGIKPESLVNQPKNSRAAIFDGVAARALSARAAVSRIEGH
jgi:phosphoglycerate dehydrogenase-like enzyme